MKRLFFLVAAISLLCVAGLGQTTYPKGTPQVMPYSYYKFPGYFQVDSGVLAPVRLPFSFPKQKGMFVYSPADTTFHVWSGYNWHPIATQLWVNKVFSGAVSAPGYNALLWDSSFKNAAFDTTTRQLTLTRSGDNSTETLTIPRGGNVTGMSALAPSRLGNIMTLTGDNGSVAQFSIRDADSATIMHYSDSSAIVFPYLRKSDTAAMLFPFVQYSDTAILVAPYLRKSDTVAMLSPFVQYSDTANLVAPYLRKIDTAAMLVPFVQYSDTANLVAPYLRKSDTTTLLSTRSWISNILTGITSITGYNKLAWDSSFKAAAFDTATRQLVLTRSGDNSTETLTIPRGGSVTGMSALTPSRLGNLLTLTGDNGSVAQFSIRDADSTTIMHFSDTSGLVAPYLRKSDTMTMLAPFVQYSDTSNLVAPYLRKIDTAAMLVPYFQYSDTSEVLSKVIRNQSILQSGADFNISGTGKAGLLESATHVKAVAAGSGDSYLFAGFKSDGTTVLASLNQTGTGAGALNLGNPSGAQTVLINGGGNSLINTGFPLLVNKGTDDGQHHNLQVGGTAHADTLSSAAVTSAMVKADAAGHLLSAISGTDYLSPADSSSDHGFTTRWRTQQKIDSLAAAVGDPINSLTPSRLGNILTLTGDNGSVSQFSIRDADSASLMHYSDSAALVAPYLRKNDTTEILSKVIRNQSSLQSGADFNISGTGKAGVLESATHVKAVAAGSGDSYLVQGTKSDGTTVIASFNQTGTGAGALNLGDASGSQTVLINGGGNSLINTGHPLLINKGTDDGLHHILQVGGTAHADTLSSAAVTSAMVKADAAGHLLSAISGTDYLSPADSSSDHGFTTRWRTQQKIDSLAAAVGGSGFVPYTGATDSVDLGNYNLTVYGIKLGRGAGNQPQNTVVGRSALTQNTFGTQNVALGLQTLEYNIIGNNNTALGTYSLGSNLSSFNTGAGSYALTHNTTGQENTSVGYNSSKDITDGSSNTVIGNYTARGLVHGNNNTIIGANVGNSVLLDSMLNNNIIVATGDGSVKLQFDSTKWNAATRIDYQGNFGSTFTDNSVVTKKYVDSSVSASSAPSYAEGDFFPAFTGYSIIVSNGHYIKINKLVTVTVNAYFDTNTNNNTVSLNNLPYAVKNNSSLEQGFPGGDINGTVIDYFSLPYNSTVMRSQKGLKYSDYSDKFLVINFSYFTN